MSNLSMVLCSSPFNAWKIALCSLSTGRIRTPYCSASGMMICPAVTKVSLLASAISLPALIPSIVGRIPIIPTIAVTRICVPSIAASSRSPSIPPTTLQSVSLTRSLSSAAFSSSPTAASLGENSRICSSSMEIFLPAARPRTCKSLFFLTISRVWVPMEPVEPKIAIFIILTFSLNQHVCQKIDKRCCKNHAVKPIQNPSMSRYQFSVIFNLFVSLNRRSSQIPYHGNQCSYGTDDTIHAFYHFNNKSSS